MSRSRKQLDELFSAVCEGTASTVQMQELAAELRSDKDVVDRYVEYVDLHALLATDPQLSLVTSCQRVVSPQLIIDGQTQWAARRKTLRTVLQAAGATAVAATLVLTVLWLRSGAEPNAGAMASPQGVRQSATGASGKQTDSVDSRVDSLRRPRGVWLLPPNQLGGLILMPPSSVVSGTAVASRPSGIELMPVRQSLPVSAQEPFTMRTVMPLARWPASERSHSVAQTEASSDDQQTLVVSTSFDEEEADSLVLSHTQPSWQRHVQSKLSMNIPSLEFDWRKTDGN